MFLKIYHVFLKWLRPSYGVVFSDEVPINFLNHTIYLIGEKSAPWQAAFYCPCGCRELIQLNLLEDVKPGWRIYFDKRNRISISPSVRRTVGCRSHFFISNGNVDWAIRLNTDVRNYSDD